MQALVDAGQLALVTGDAPAALAFAQQAVSLDPLSEPPYQVLMTAAYALGRQSEALAAFDRCRRLLADELGADPLDETVALHLAILRHESIAELLPGDRGASRRLSGVLVAPSVDLGLLGRERELAELRAAADRASGGRFTVVVVSGSTGLGKTRLVEEVAGASDLGVAANRCSDLEQDFPYLALTMALDGAPGAGARSLPGVDALVERMEQLPRFDPTTGLGLMESFAHALSSTTPLLLWLDDVQWADHETLTTLNYLQRRCPRAPVLVVVTCDRSRASAAAVRRLRADVRVDLEPLTADCVEQLGHPELHATTGGHPLYVAGWLEARRQRLEQPFPPALCERVLMQCWDAGPQAYRLLCLAAALDETSFAAELLASLAGLSLEAVADDLDRLFELGLLTSCGADMRFCTPALRTVMADTLSPASRSVTRTRAAALQDQVRRPA